jgi:hypothetical protein
VPQPLPSPNEQLAKTTPAVSLSARTSTRPCRISMFLPNRATASYSTPAWQRRFARVTSKTRVHGRVMGSYCRICSLPAACWPGTWNAPSVLSLLPETSVLVRPQSARSSPLILQDTEDGRTADPELLGNRLRLHPLPSQLNHLSRLPVPCTCPLPWLWQRPRADTPA